MPHDENGINSLSELSWNSLVNLEMTLVGHGSQLALGVRSLNRQWLSIAPTFFRKALFIESFRAASQLHFFRCTPC